MASKKKLKRDLNNVMGDIIEAAMIHQLANPEEKTDKSEKIIDEAIASFDEFIVKINDRKIENQAKHLKEVNAAIEAKAKTLIEKVNKL